MISQHLLKFSQIKLITDGVLDRENRESFVPRKFKRIRYVRTQKVRTDDGRVGITLLTSVLNGIFSLV